MLRTGVSAIARRAVPSGHGASAWLPLYILAQFVGGFAGAILGARFTCVTSTKVQTYPYWHPDSQSCAWSLRLCLRCLYYLALILTLLLHLLLNLLLTLLLGIQVAFLFAAPLSALAINGAPSAAPGALTLLALVVQKVQILPTDALAINGAPAAAPAVRSALTFFTSTKVQILATEALGLRRCPALCSQALSYQCMKPSAPSV